MDTDDPHARLSDDQRERLDAYSHELARVNRQINLISPASVPVIAERHIRHSLSIAVRCFPDGATVVDWGSGGGLPSLPLAVAFPNVRFIAVDAVRKKTEAVRLFARRLGVENLDIWNGRAERFPYPIHYAVSRATAPLLDLWTWFAACRTPLDQPAPKDCWTPGLICLKGGDLRDEISALRAAAPQATVEALALDTVLGEGWSDKAILHVSERLSATG